MKILESVPLIFDSGKASFGYLNKIAKTNVEKLAIDTNEGVTLPQGEYITQEQFKKCTLSLQKNSVAIVQDVPCSFFQPSALKNFTNIPEGNGIDFEKSKVQYLGNPADVQGKLILFIFYYE